MKHFKWMTFRIVTKIDHITLSLSGPGCDESQMLGVGLPFGRFMSMFQGSFYRYAFKTFQFFLIF